jgi:hypothetical protein|tara:strand:+ start:1499 stop:1738 length:240 start_codon:yes stop_codon:yes gene_type:complete
MGGLKGAIQGAISVLLSLLLLPITLGAVNTLTAVDTNGDSTLGLDSSTLQILSILPIVLVAGAIFLVIRTSWADKGKDK